MRKRRRGDESALLDRGWGLVADVGCSSLHQTGRQLVELGEVV